MQRRTTTAVAAAVLLLTLLGCDPKSTPQSEPPPAPTGDLCQRVQPQLSGNWKPGAKELRLYAPLSDSCVLVETAQSSHQIRFTLSILPVTSAQATVVRKSDEASIASWYAAKVVDGGIGADSWALNPAAAAPWLAFRTAGRLIRLSDVNDGSGTLDELRSIARTILSLPGGLPTSPAAISRPECTRGTAAAERLLGSHAVVRRDALVDKHLSCQWGSETRSVVVRSGSLGSDQSLTFDSLKKLSSSGYAHRVGVGIEGWQQSDGVLVFRTAGGSYVEVTGTPGSTLRPAPILALARAIAPAYF